MGHEKENNNGEATSLHYLKVVCGVGAGVKGGGDKEGRWANRIRWPIIWIAPNSLQVLSCSLSHLPHEALCPFKKWEIRGLERLKDLPTRWQRIISATDVFALKFGNGFQIHLGS